MSRYSRLWVVVWLVLAPCAALAVPSAVPYAGFLAHEDGTPYEGTVSLRVSAYGQAEGGEPVWGPAQFDGVEVQGGVLAVVLGETGSPLDSSLLGGEGLWLAIEVNGTAMTPRQRVLSAPYALRAGDSERLGGVLAQDYATKGGLTQALSGYALTKDLQPVCFSGKYGDLVDAPDLSAFVTVGQMADYATKASLSAVAFSGRFGDLVEVPEFALLSQLASVAMSGRFGDLVEVPEFALLSQLASVAMSGRYGDLDGRPDLTVYLRSDGTVGLSGDLDVGRHRLMNVAVEASAESPESPVSGQLWWDETSGLLRVYDGVQWRGLETGPQTLPPDGLSAVSNGTMTNVLEGEYDASGLPVGIGSERDVAVVVQDAGRLRGVTVSFRLSHPYVPEVEVRLIPPGDAVGVRLVKAGAGAGTSLDMVVTETDALPDGGTLVGLLGREQSGTWVLRVTDTVVNGNEGTGEVTGFGLQTRYLASGQVAVSGGMSVAGDQSVSGDQMVLGQCSCATVVAGGQDVALEIAALHAQLAAQNAELAAQNAELAAQSEQLAVQNGELWCLRNCDANRIGDCKERECDGAMRSCVTGGAQPDGTACLGGAGRCKSGQCCVAEDHKECVGGNLYWYDSCDNPGGLVEVCRHGCREGECFSPCPAGYVLVPAGTFLMGSPESEPGRQTDEVQHPVTISRGFCLKETEVTQGEWEAEMGNNPSVFSSCGSSCPVEKVSWWDAVAYCNRKSQREGLEACYTLTGCSGTPGAGNYTCSGVTFMGLTCRGYRLPTESEWEYAARAGTTVGTYNGTSSITDCTTPNGVLDAIAWWKGNSCTTPPSTDCSGGIGCKPQAVKGKQPNGWGLYDMLGNVWEWCWDWYGTYPGTASDPTGPSTGSFRVRRGGSWYNDAGLTRAAKRRWGDPGDRRVNLGFRPARSVP